MKKNRKIRILDLWKPRMRLPISD